MRHSVTALIEHQRHPRLLAWAAALILAGILGALPAARAESPPQALTLLDRDARLPVLSEGRSGVVVWKEQDDPRPADSADRNQTISVFVDGTYHASLPKASWAFAEVCPGTHSLLAVRDQAILAVNEARPSGQPIEFAPSSTLYFRLSENEQGTPRLDAIEAGVARTMIDQLPRAIHTISRLQARECVQPKAVEPQPQLQAIPSAPIETATSYTLRSSTFFEFDDAQISQKSGRRLSELDEIIQKVRASHSTVNLIDVNGYADPTGSAAYNLTLSRKRAETVARRLGQAGFSGTAINAKGFGATNLVVPDCATWLKTPQQIRACNEPNRRVELIVHGQARN